LNGASRRRDCVSFCIFILLLEDTASAPQLICGVFFALRTGADRKETAPVAGGRRTPELPLPGVQYMCWPPLIEMFAPVRNAASSLAR
jgi:hypothetical protein